MHGIAVHLPDRQCRRAAWLSIAAAAALVLAVSVPRTRRGIERFGSWVATPLAGIFHRAIPPHLTEPRITQWGGSSRRLVLVSNHRRMPWQFLGSAGQAVDVEQSDPTPHDLHGAGVAALLRNDWNAAVSSFEEALRQDTGDSVPARAIEQSENAELLADLSAAYIARGMHDHRSRDLLSAISAADASTRADDELAEGFFNRALAIELVRMRGDAQKAWERYLEVDDDSEWATEARTHLRALSAEKSAPSWEEARASLDRAATDGDLRLVRALVERHPQQARTLAEEDLAAAWGSAMVAGRTDAPANLARLRAIGAALASAHQDLFVHDTVAAIDAATNVLPLAKAHATYREAQTLMSSQQFTDARVKLEEASAAFTAAGSPFALLARTQVAACDAQTSGPPGGLAILATVDTSAYESRYPALAARVASLRGAWQLTLGRPYEALQSCRAARAIYQKLHEGASVALVENIAAGASELAGDVDASWDSRFAALQQLEQDGSSLGLEVTLREAATAALAEQELRAALMFSDRLLSLTHADAARGEADAFVLRSRIRRFLGDAVGSLDDLTRARNGSTVIADASARGRVQQRIRWEEADVSRAVPAALPQLDAAVHANEQPGRQPLLAIALLDRGRAFLAAGNRHAAQLDFAAGIDAAEAGDSSAQDCRAGEMPPCSNGVDSLYQSMIGVLGRDRRIDDLFVYSERARWRAADVRNGEAPDVRRVPFVVTDIQRSLPDHVVLIESSMTDDGRLLQLVIRRSSVELVDSRVDAVAVAAETEGLAAAAEAEDGAETRRILVGLSQAILDPLRPFVGGSDELVFVPDQRLGAVPFGALLDTRSGRFLTEDFSVLVVPSASTYVTCVDRDRELAAVPARLPVTINAGVGRTATVDTAQAVLAAMGAATVTTIELPSIANSRHPAQAALFIGPAGSDDIALYAHDIASSHFDSTRLVVLPPPDRRSAPLAVSMPALPRAFLHAGVPAVVGNLWRPAATASKLLMARFHHYLDGGEDASHALRHAQASLIAEADPALHSAAAWGGFQLFGAAAH